VAVALLTAVACHPERSEGSPQLSWGSVIYEQLQRSFASLRMTDGVFLRIGEAEVRQ